MKKKYIIELEDDVTLWGFLTDTDGEIAVVGVIKQPYTEPDMEQVRKEAYEQGYHAGYGKYINKSFEDGLKASWETARKIICEMDCEDHMKIFGGDNLEYIFALSPTTVIDKIRRYEKKEEKIQVVDEVMAASGKAVVTAVGPVYFEYVYAGGSIGSDKVENAKKTGRHFPEIAAVFAKMKEGE